jgi:exonuclease III
VKKIHIEVFNWLVSKKYDCICLQETHCTGVDINRWESEWKTQGGGASAWLCGSSESKGVAILLIKHYAFDINFNFSDKTGRLLFIENTIKISQNIIVMIDTIIYMVVRNVLKRIEKLFSITA